MPRKIKGKLGADNNIDGISTEFEDSDDDIELEDAQGESEPTPSVGIAVTFQERSITRTFGKQKLVSGGRQVRYFTPEQHGKNYAKVAQEFIDTMKIQDENSSERPKYISHQEI